jgi:membrane-associated phospholipid phosphatase
MVVGTVVVFAALFLKIADSVRESEAAVRIDGHVMDFVVRHRVGWISQVARAVTVLGSGWVVTIVVLGATALLVRRHRRGDALFVVLSTVGTAILIVIAKHAIARPRPPAVHRLVSAGGASFPSAHAAQSVACYAALAAVAVTATRSARTRVLVCTAAAAIAAAVGASRVYLGVHFPSDVLSGWLLAAGWLLALIVARGVVAPAGASVRGRAPRAS